MSKVIKSLILAIFAYLFQVSVMPLIPIYNVSASSIIAVLAIVVVAYGRQYGITLSFIFGILMETMMPSLDYLYLVLYPTVGVLGTIAFSDKTDRRLEMERNLNKRGENIHPLIRTPLAAMLMAAVFESINIAYVMLRGVDFDSENLTRIIVSVLYTTLVCAVIMIPLRSFLGIKLVLPSQINLQRQEKAPEIDPRKGKQVIKPKTNKKNDNDNSDDNIKDDIITPNKLIRRNALYKSPTAIPASIQTRDYNEEDFKPKLEVPRPDNENGDLANE